MPSSGPCMHPLHLQCSCRSCPTDLRVSTPATHVSQFRHSCCHVRFWHCSHGNGGLQLPPEHGANEQGKLVMLWFAQVGRARPCCKEEVCVAAVQLCSKCQFIMAEPCVSLQALISLNEMYNKLAAAGTPARYGASCWWALLLASLDWALCIDRFVTALHPGLFDFHSVSTTAGNACTRFLS